MPDVVPWARRRTRLKRGPYPFIATNTQHRATPKTAGDRRSFAGGTEGQRGCEQGVRSHRDFSGSTVIREVHVHARADPGGAQSGSRARGRPCAAHLFGLLWKRAVAWAMEAMAEEDEEKEPLTPQGANRREAVLSKLMDHAALEHAAEIGHPELLEMGITSLQDRRTALEILAEARSLELQDDPRAALGFAAAWAEVCARF